MKTVAKRWVYRDDRHDELRIHARRAKSVRAAEAGSTWIDRCDIACMFKVPKCKRYQVEYRLSKRKTKIWVHASVVCANRRRSVVCWLPDEWHGHVTRKVLAIER